MKNLLLPAILALSLAACNACASVAYPQRVTREIERLENAQALVEIYVVPGDEYAEYLPGLEMEARRLVKSFSYNPALFRETGAFGWSQYDAVAKEWAYIIIDANLNSNTRVTTLLHELAHVKHGPYVQGEGAEVVAEAVALEAAELLGMREAYVAAYSYLYRFNPEFREGVMELFEPQIKKWGRQLADIAKKGA